MTTKSPDNELTLEPNTTVAVRIALAEDHELVREGLKALLQSQPSFSIVGEAADGLQAVELVNRTNPEVLLLDLRMPRLHGLEVIRQLKDRKKTKILVVSMYPDEPYLVEALRAGVNGYILKACPAKELVNAIRTVANGGTYVCEELRQKALSASLRKLDGKGAKENSGLTKRERLVLELAAEGLTSAQVASRLFISRRTAEAHRANLMRKLGLKTQTDLVLYAVRNNIISP